MKKAIFLSLAICTQAYAKDILIQSTIPAGQKVAQVYANMYSSTESIRCASLTHGTDIKVVKAKVEIKSETAFTAKISGKEIEKLANSHCKYQGPEVIVILENPNKELTEQTLYESDAGSWIVTRTEEI